MSETGDGLDHLRIPLDQIKFGKKLETEGYGTVFEGEFDGQRVALKQLNITNLANVKPKLLAEILTKSRFRHHPNLVALLGFCDEKSNEITLVYEYVSGGNLADKMMKRLNTIQRFEICLGAARGLDYLHTGVDSTTIVHGNIKLSKILLNPDSDPKRFIAKVSSFGLSKIVPGKGLKSDESPDEETPKATNESDVFSFGVLLLEVLCGVSELVDTDDYVERHVTEIVPKKLQQNKLLKLVHKDIRKEIKPEALETYAKIACECVVEEPEARPTMARVVEELEKALRLQGGEVTYVKIPSSGASIKEGVKDLVDGEDNGDGVTVSESSNGEKNTESVPSETLTEDAQDESSNSDPTTIEVSLNDLNSTKESNNTVENEEDNDSKIPTEDVHKETITTVRETVEETKDDIDSNKESNVIEENNEDDQSKNITTTTSTNQEVQDSGILKSDRGYFNEVNHEDELESSSNDPAMKKETSNDLNSGKEDENKEENEIKIPIEDAHNEMSTIDRGTVEETTNDFDVDKKSTINEENKDDDQSMKVTTTSESSNGDIRTSTKEVQDRGYDIATENETLNDLNIEKESNITVEKEEEDKSKIPIEDAHKETSTTDRKTVEETTNDFDADKKPTIPEENKEVDKRTKVTTTSEFSNGDTSTSTDQDVQDKGDFSEVVEDELEHLRIPFDEIKFGEKLDVRGYGTMFEGEYNHQQVALKRLNITNLGNIKPKLLSAILTISRFHQHPNLVALIGFCDENNKEIILVYEYVSGGTLADKMSKHLTTIQRLQVCLGAARGLEYLHIGIESVDSNPGIIHGDLRLSKILLKSDSVSSEFDAKVSGFGLPKLLPGHVEIGPRSKDPVYAATGKLTKESDVYTFGVLLLEVLCGVPELVDTDDYQERHVTELVPKRLEQNLLRKTIHFDIRDEITTEALETYAKIACKCVKKDPEERPTMTEVVIELEKALRLQGGKVSGVQIFGSSNANGLPEVPVGVDDHKGDENGETMSLNVTEEESKVIEEAIDDVPPQGQSFPVPDSDSNDVETVPEDTEKENGDNERESIDEITVDLKSNEESKIIEENDVDSESNITTTSKSYDGDDNNSATDGNVSDAKLLASSNGNGLPDEVPAGEDSHEGDENGETKSSNIIEEESKATEEATDEKDNEDNINVPKIKEETVVDVNSNEETKINEENEANNESKITTLASNSDMQEHVLKMNTPKPHTEEIMEVQNSVIVDDDAKSGLSNTEKPELVVSTRGDFSYSTAQTEEPKTKRSNSTSSESSNGDDTTPADYLLPKSPENEKKTRDYGTCGCCCWCCSCWRFISERVVLYGGQFWNKLASWFTWITGSSKKD